MTAKQLTIVVQQLLIFIKTQTAQTLSLENLAYTLQTGRNIMNYRLAFITKNIIT